MVAMPDLLNALPGTDRGHVRRAWLAAAWVVWALLNIGLLWIYYAPATKVLVGDEFDYNQRALALLAGKPMPELFIWPPGQTGFIALVYRVFGAHVLAVQLVQMAVLALCAILLVRLWKTLDDSRAALAAGALFLLNPSTLAHAHWLWPEVTHLACLLGALVLLLTLPGRPRLRAFLAGLLIGLSLLFKSLLGGFWPIFLLFFLGRGERGYSYAWMAALAFVAGMLLPISPALWKGQLETGRPLIADSSMYNLEVGIRDTRRSDYIDEAGLPALTAFLDSASTPQQRNAMALDRIRSVVAEHGIVNVMAERLGTQYFRLFNAKTLLVSQLPGPACAGQLGAYGPSALAAPLTVLAYVTHSATLVLGAFGIALWRRWRRPLAAFLGLFLVYQLLLYAGLHVMQRYLFQMLPVLCGFAGSFLVGVGRREHRSEVLVLSRWRVALGAGLALLLLGLAWLGPILDGNCT
jgi:4-amino-4-deoxy-L-arabinose transferase-like glycosyltransferase